MGDFPVCTYVCTYVEYICTYVHTYVFLRRKQTNLKFLTNPLKSVLFLLHVLAKVLHLVNLLLVKAYEKFLPNKTEKSSSLKLVIKEKSQTM